MTPAASSILLLVPDGTFAAEVRGLADAREGAGPEVDVVVAEGSAVEEVARARAAGAGRPLGFVARTDEAVIAWIAAGVDDACLATGLGLRAFVAFLDRVMLRARQRRDAENRLAAAAQAEKLAALGTLVAGVAHEVNNPLGVVMLLNDTIRLMAEPLLRAQEEIARLAARGAPATRDELAHLDALSRTGASPSEVRASFGDMDGALSTIRDIVRGLRIYARAGGEEKEDAVYLPELVEQVLRVVGVHVTAVAELERDYGNDVPTLLLPRSGLTQVLTNLLINAAQAVGSVARPMHRVRISIRCDSEALALSVSDSGPGIAPEHVERIFDPFFTTKRLEGMAGGTGLGLSISRSILQSLAGDLVVESVHGQGATFIAIIPVEGRRVAARPRAPSTAKGLQSASSRPSVLIIDDEEALLRSVAIALRGRFDVLLAGDGQEAIDLLSSGSRPDAILCDITMPIVDGPRFLRWLIENRPELAERTAFMTGDGASASTADFASHARAPIVDKPIARDKLLLVLAQLVARGGETRAEIAG